jgi:HAE1 family hydrophobic/amphiphilic exporter-1
VDVETAIAEAMTLLPPGMPRPQSSARSTRAISHHQLVSDLAHHASQRLDEYAETMMAQRISMVDGVAQVQVFGAAKYAVRVQVDPNELASRKSG